MNQADVIGYVAALLVFVTFWMKTMVPLRMLGIASNVFFIGYGYLAAAYPPLLLHILLLPLNLHAAARNAATDQAGERGRFRQPQHGLAQAVFLEAADASRRGSVRQRRRR